MVDEGTVDRRGRKAREDSYGQRPCAQVGCRKTIRSKAYEKKECPEGRKGRALDEEVAVLFPVRLRIAYADDDRSIEREQTQGDGIERLEKRLEERDRADKVLIGRHWQVQDDTAESPDHQHGDGMHQPAAHCFEGDDLLASCKP